MESLRKDALYTGGPADDEVQHKSRHQLRERFDPVCNTPRVISLHGFSLDPVLCQTSKFGKTFVQSDFTQQISLNGSVFGGGKMKFFRSQKKSFPRLPFSYIRYSLLCSFALLPSGWTGNMSSVRIVFLFYKLYY